MKLIFTFLILILFTVMSCDEKEEEFPLENGVILLTEKNFGKAIAKYDHLLVLFFAPWCGHCKRFHPDYEKAAQTLRGENIFLAKVNCDAEVNLKKKFKITGYPTVKLFVDGEPEPYTSGRQAQQVIDWMREHTRPVIRTLKNVKETESFKSVNGYTLIYFNPEKEGLAEFTKVAKNFSKKNKNYLFGVADFPDAAKSFDKKPNTVLVSKEFWNERYDVTNVTENSLTEIINIHFTPKVTKFTGQVGYIVFQRKVPGLFLWAHELSENYKKLKDIMENVNKKIGNDILCILTDINEAETTRVEQILGIKSLDLPAVRIVDVGKDKKYKMEGEITEDNIIKFYQNYVKGTVQPYYRSEKEPTDNNGDVKILVSTNYKKEIMAEGKDVVVDFCKDRNFNCGVFYKVFSSVAKKLRVKNPNLVFGKFDIMLNELEDSSVFDKMRELPALVIFPAGKKDKYEMIQAVEKEEQIIKFIREHATNKLILDDEKSSDL